MTTAITPEIVGLETIILEDSPMTPAEQRKLVELETRIKTKLGNKMEADLAIGGALLQIQRERLYRSPKGGRSFDDYIKRESHRLTPDEQPIGTDTATRLRGFYYFREEVLRSGANRHGTAELPLPTSAYQVRPLLFLLDHLHRDRTEIRSNQPTVDERRAAEAKAIEIWKGACAQAGEGNVPTFDQVNRARLADESAEQHRLRGSANSQPPIRPTPPKAASEQQSRVFINNEATWPSDMKRDKCNIPSPQSPPPSVPAPLIPAWEMEKDDASIDAGAECKRITQAINDAHKAIGMLRGILYSQINKHGRDYLGVLRQVDAGVYSLHNIDSQVQQISEDIDFISELLTADVGEGELAQSTVDVASFPTRA
jgi:hypothetical protein